MRILQIGKFYPIRGGVEKVMWDLTEGLSLRGYSCDMLCAMLRKSKVDKDHEFHAQKTSEGTVIHLGDKGRVICVPARAKLAATMISPAMIGWMRKHAAEYDIVHIHHPDPMAALAPFLSGYKGRVILHWHSDILTRRILLMFYFPLQSWLIRRADRIVGTTPIYIRDSRYLQQVQQKTLCIPIGIYPIVYDEKAARHIRDRYPDKKIVFSLGRLVPYKGFTSLVQAAEYLPDDYIVLLGGEGPLKKDLAQMIEKLGLQEKVKLLGFVSNTDLPAYYGACDVFAMCSRWKTEAFGIVLIEAMSCGKPVVATVIPHSGVPWVNEDGVSGLNVPIENSASLAVGIMEICTNPRLYEAFSKRARERYEAYFSIQDMIEKTIELYENEL